MIIASAQVDASLNYNKARSQVALNTMNKDAYNHASKIKRAYPSIGGAFNKVSFGFTKTGSFMTMGLTAGAVDLGIALHKVGIANDTIVDNTKAMVNYLDGVKATANDLGISFAEIPKLKISSDFGDTKLESITKMMPALTKSYVSYQLGETTNTTNSLAQLEKHYKGEQQTRGKQQVEKSALYKYNIKRYTIVNKALHRAHNADDIIKSGEYANYYHRSSLPVVGRAPLQVHKNELEVKSFKAYSEPNINKVQSRASSTKIGAFNPADQAITIANNKALDVLIEEIKEFMGFFKSKFTSAGSLLDKHDNLHNNKVKK